MLRELIVILCVVLILFGGKKLPEFAKSLGKGIREFKKATQGIDEEVDITTLQDKSKRDHTSLKDSLNKETPKS
jgi:sec-independent protein translocase protein TatA